MLEMQLAGRAPRPVGGYSPADLADLADALNQASMLFPAADPVPEVDRPVRVLPPEYLRAYARISEAAKDYGVTLTPLEDLAPGRAMKVAAARIDALAQDPKFAEFLNEEIPAEEMGLVEEEVEGEEDTFDLEEMDLEDADLEGMDLEDADLEEMDLEEEVVEEEAPATSLKDLMRKRAK